MTATATRHGAALTLAQRGIPSTRPSTSARAAIPVRAFREVALATLAQHPGDTSHGSRVQFWIDLLGDTPIAEINGEHVADGTDVLAARKRLLPRRTREGMIYIESDQPLSGGTINRYISSLGTVFKDARAMRLTPRGMSSPTRGAERMPVSKGRKVNVNAEQVRHLVACARMGRNPALSALVALAATSGLRMGNIQSIRWCDVNLSAKFIDVEVTKNDEPHRAVLLPWVADELSRWRKLQQGEGAKRSEGDLVFGPMNPKRSYASALRMADLPETWTFHHLRHCAASILAQAGLGTAAIMSTLGQKSPSMALRYSHVNTQSQRQALAQAWQQSQRAPSAVSSPGA